MIDPFLGSGSTLIAAQNTGRRCRGVEIDPRYVDVTIRRFQAETGLEAVLETTRETFAELAARRFDERSGAGRSETVRASPNDEPSTGLEGNDA